MKVSQAFLQAKRYLPIHRYICYALQWEVRGEAAEQAAKIVSARIACADDNGKLPCAERWLKSKGLNLTFDEVQRWRFMWLDRLAAEFEAKGE